MISGQGKADEEDKHGIQRFHPVQNKRISRTH